MKTIKIDENRRCPKCNKVTNQINKGFNRSGTHAVCARSAALHPDFGTPKSMFSAQPRDVASGHCSVC